MSKHAGIIVGSGLSGLSAMQACIETQLETPYGLPSAPLQQGKLAGKDVFLLPRHGNPHLIAPHMINYRANIWALQHLGVEQIIAVNAVGGITPSMETGIICFPDQIIDYTYGREHTFSGSEAHDLQHIDFTWPFSQCLRNHLMTAAQSLAINTINQGVYAAAQGPRLETAAEIRRMERDGCDVVGMTAMPEAALARELGMDYASICLVVNPAAGKTTELITMGDIKQVMQEGMDKIEQLIHVTLSQLD